MDRRDFLRAVALAGFTFAIRPGKAMDILTQSVSSANGETDLVGVMGGEPAAMVRRGITELGGMARFVKRGQKIVVKPNIGWAMAPERGANTNPELVAAIVRQCLAAGAAEVSVCDHTGNEWRACYTKSGIEEAASGAGAKVIPGHDEK